MKRLLLGFLVFQFFTFAANAQIQKGSIMLGGNVNYSNSSSTYESSEFDPIATYSNTKENSSSFTFNPKVGFTLNKNWVVGPMLFLSSGNGTTENTWSSGSSTSSSNYTSKNSSFGAGAFARKYLPFNEHFSAFGELNATANNRKESDKNGDTSDIDESETKYNLIEGKLQVGIAYFPRSWMNIELSTNIIKYVHSGQKRGTESQDFESNYDNFYFGLNASAINLGVSFFLNNK